jgi:hypothetical protein
METTCVTPMNMNLVGADASDVVPMPADALPLAGGSYGAIWKYRTQFAGRAPGMFCDPVAGESIYMLT